MHCILCLLIEYFVSHIIILVSLVPTLTATEIEKCSQQFDVKTCHYGVTDAWLQNIWKMVLTKWTLYAITEHHALLV